MDGPERGLSQAFLDYAPAQPERTPASLPRAAGHGGPAVVGRPRLYSYNNVSAPKEDWECSCGHAAIATLLDFHGRVDLPAHLRTVRGAGLADDGRLHYPNDLLVGRIFEEHPPVNFFGLRFVVREIIAAAMQKAKLRTDEAYPGALGDKAERFAYARAMLCDWIARTGLPVIVLVNTKPLGGVDGLHWGIIHAFDQDTVFMASWHRVYQYSWAQFAPAWHCEGWIWPNNFYALYVAP